MDAKKEDQSERSHQSEKQSDVVKRSVWDIVKDNLKLAQRNTYVHRSIYIGEHYYTDLNDKSVNDVYDAVIKHINEKYCDEKLTGYLLYYNKYFCVVIDGSEDALRRHLKMIARQDAVESKFGKMKMLCNYHHVNQRMLKEWTSLPGKPPTLLERIPHNAEIQQTMQKVRYVIDKLYSLGILLRPTEKPTDEEGGKCKNVYVVDHRPSGSTGAKVDQRSASSTATMSRSTTISRSANSSTFGQTAWASQFMPEYSVLEFLLESPFTMDLRNFIKVYGSVQYRECYEDMTWPATTDFTPMNVASVDIDPITDIDTDSVMKN